MTIPDRYEAAWAPGLDTDTDADVSLELGLNWIEDLDVPGEAAIVMNATKMSRNRPLLEWAAQRYPFISPQSRTRLSTPTGHAVLAVWPGGEALELAQRLALDGGLCVIGGNVFDVTPWIVRTHATNLAAPDNPGPAAPDVDEAVAKALDSVLFFGGNNSFLGGGEKKDAVRRLRSLVADGHRPSPDTIESYALASGKTGHKGARRLREFYEGILAGKGFRDYDGRLI
jgi:hypothetical protein